MRADRNLRLPRFVVALLHAAIFAALLIVNRSTVAAQQTTSAVPLRADSVAASTEFDEALQRAEQLLREGKVDQAASALSEIGEAQYAKGLYLAARETGLKTLTIYEDLASQRGIGRANHLLSLVADREGDAPGARRFAERAVTAFEAADDRRGRAVSTLQLIRVGRLGAEAEQSLYQRVIADARAVGDRMIEAGALHSLGDHLFTRGEYEASLENLEAAAALCEAIGPQAQGELGTVYNSLGRIYRSHGRLDAALASQLRALALHEKSNSPFNHMQSLNAVAVTYQSLGDPRQARAYFTRALALAEQISTPKIQDFLRANLASTILDEGDNRAAAQILEGVIARGLDSYPAARIRELSDAYLGLHRNEDALAQAQKAVDLCNGRQDLECIRAMDQRASVHAALGNNDRAIADLRTALETIEAVRSRLVPADFFKQQFTLAQEEIYSRTIDLQVRQGQGADALETAELARSRAFVDLLASRDLPIAAGGGPVLQATEARQSDSIGGLPLVFRGTTATTTRGTTPSSSTTAPAPTAGLNLSSPASAPAASSRDLIDTARRLRSTVLAYWVTSDKTFIWVVTPEGSVRAFDVDVRTAKLVELIRATTPFNGAGQDRAGGRTDPAGGRTDRAVATRGSNSIAIPATAATPWRELYNILIKPVGDALPRSAGSLITVVPHGPLGALAFAALQDEQGKYLLERYTIHYAPAGAVLRFTAAERHDESRQGSVLIVSDPVPPALSSLDSPLPRLPGARAEGRAIGRLVPRARLTTLEGDAAKEGAVREAASGKAVLHFATHAIVRDDDPFASFLAVGKTSEDDGVLTAEEIYGLHLDADLVVLSACRSAGGGVPGDGVATFARAFIYAGTPSIIASLWDVADEPTNRLLPAFYQSWFGGLSKARALRAAQLQLLADLRGGKVRINTAAGPIALPENPVFWAGFALIGEP